jgi:hypothetical protein
MLDMWRVDKDQDLQGRTPCAIGQVGGWVGEPHPGGGWSPRLERLGGNAVNGLAALLGEGIVGATIA